MKTNLKIMMLLLSLTISKRTNAFSFETVNNHLRMGYTFYSYEENIGNALEIGFFNRHTYADQKFHDFQYASKGPSLMLVGLWTENKFLPGIKLGYEADFIVFSGKMDVSLIGSYFSVSPRIARRYHWHSPCVRSFTEQPHSFIYGKNQGEILNLTDKSAVLTKQGMLQLTKEDHKQLLAEIPALIMPLHHDVREKDVNIKRLGAALALAQEEDVNDMESLLLLEGVGPRTIQSLALVSEVIHGTPSRFKDPARFSFAHGGKDGHPFPVPEKVYDETIAVLEKSLQKAKLGINDKAEALKKLHLTAQRIEKDFKPNDRFDELIQEERDNSWKYGGRTVYGYAVKPENVVQQLSLFS